MIAYVDTQVAIWLASGMLKRMSLKAMAAIQRSEPLLSPMVLLEAEYLYEVGRSRLRAQDIVRKLESEIGLRMCALSFSDVAAVAAQESWTRDPFDRIIVAQARANGLSPLISSDEQIAEHYPRTIW